MHAQHSTDAQVELQALQGAKQDVELGQAMLIDKLQQCKAENEQMTQQMEKLKARLTNSAQDYVDILQHRGEQIKAGEMRANSLQQQLERLQQELAQTAKDVATLKVGDIRCWPGLLLLLAYAMMQQQLLKHQLGGCYQQQS